MNPHKAPDWGRRVSVGHMRTINVRAAKNMLGVEPDADDWKGALAVVGIKVSNIQGAKRAKSFVMAPSYEPAARSSEIVQLTKRVNELEVRIGEIPELKRRIAELEECAIDETGDPMRDPYREWCTANKAMLVEEYPASYVAIDIKAGVVRVAAPDQVSFAKKYESLPDSEKDNLYYTHTSKYG